MFEKKITFEFNVKGCINIVSPTEMDFSSKFYKITESPVRSLK